MKKFIQITLKTLLFVALLSPLSLLSCMKGAADPDILDLEPIDRVDIPLTTKQAELSDIGNDLAFSFLSYVSNEEGPGKDITISPLSLQFLLGLLSDGAEGQTLSQILSVLGFPEGTPRELSDGYFSTMMSYLGVLDNTVRISLANAAFVREGISFKPVYEQMIEKNFDASVFTFPANNPAKGVSDLNSWCSDRTNGMIPNLIDSVDPSVLAYIVNALYFKGTWRRPFDAKLSSMKPFHRPGGKDVQVEMMSRVEATDYAKDGTCSAISLPYGNGAYNMMFILPADPGEDIATFLSSFKAERWYRLLASMNSLETDVLLPKFETSYAVALKKMLRAMGMEDAFSGEKADFSAMSDTPMFISEILQKARIKIEERGTEAAAATVAMLIGAASPGAIYQNPVFHADRPFIYILYEKSTSAILMCGQYCGENR